jgi:plastocyanin
MCLALLLATPTQALPAEIELEPITIDIRGRMFIPNHVLIHHNQQIILRFRNHDTELHTVAAKDLFFGADITVGGNGFPEFGPDGLKRVIIPPDGLIEIQFTPTRTGAFSYLCDMPGHDMKAVIRVE